MKAIIRKKYGSPDVLSVGAVEKPIPKDDEVLIKVSASSVNPLDWHIMRAQPAFIRLSGHGLLKPKHKILGADISGTVVSIGKNVNYLQINDEVFAEIQTGGFAEYAVTTVDRVAKKPLNLSFEEAAAIPVAGLTALQSIRDHGQLKKGQSILINGTSGGVGSFSVQIAKYFEGEITAVCSTEKVEQTQSLGAHHVIDYRNQDVYSQGQTFDLIIDNVGNLQAQDFKKLLKPHGRGIAIGFKNIWTILGIKLRSSKKDKLYISDALTKVNTEDLEFLKELAEGGHIKPVIDKVYSFEEIPHAIRHLELGHAFGKIVITM
ncbi:MAG: NAD(P)-dependent alcohol dehydrogenase [Reichenbachiella sp.]